MKMTTPAYIKIVSTIRITCFIPSSLRWVRQRGCSYLFNAATCRKILYSIVPWVDSRHPTPLRAPFYAQRGTFDSILLCVCAEHFSLFLLMLRSRDRQLACCFTLEPCFKPPSSPSRRSRN